jgi:hypothetical protein
MPRFAAEASLYRTLRHYKTGRGRQPVSSSPQMLNQVWPALEQEGDGEVIRVHGCPAGWGGSWPDCIPPPLTEPPTGGGGDGWPPGDGSTDGGYGGGGGTPGHVCNWSDPGRAVAEQTCKAYGQKKGISNVYAWCVPKGGGTAKFCCWKKPNGTACVPVTTAMQGT